jgi:hypothetical protein
MALRERARKSNAKLRGFLALCLAPCSSIFAVPFVVQSRDHHTHRTTLYIQIVEIFAIFHFRWSADTHILIMDRVGQM